MTPIRVWELRAVWPKTMVYYRLVRQPDADCERQLRGLVRTFAVKIRGPESCK